MQASASHKLYENEVQVFIKSFFQADPARAQGIDAFNGMDTSTKFSDNLTTSPAYVAYGTAGILLEAAKYYDPSFTNTQLDGSNNLSRGVMPGQAGVNLEP